MRLYNKLFIGALAATALFAALATSASANRFSISNRNIRTVFTALEFRAPEAATTITCAVTMEGTFHSNTIAKVTNALVGFINRATVNTPGCTNIGGSGNGRALVLQETLPWHIRYNSFLGTLPEARIRLQLMNAGFRLLGLTFGATCVYNASPFGIVEGPTAGSGINRGNAFLRAEEVQGFEGEGFGCPLGRFAGRGPITLTGTTTPVTVRLI